MFHIIVNENNLGKKNLKKLEEVEEIFERANKDYEICLTAHAGHAKELTEEITDTDSEQSVIAMGGDGTLHEVLNGIKNMDVCSLGLIPLGTGNDFAQSANIPLNAKKAAEIIAFKVPRPIDYIQFSSGVRSINAAGMGIDVDVLKRAYAGGSTKKSKYLRALIVSLAKFESYKYTVRYDGKEEEHFGLIAAVGNGKQLGGGIKLFPEAEIDDGYLNLLTVDYISRFATIGAFVKLMLGKVNAIKQVNAVRTKAATFIADKNYTVQADGELYENTPLDVSIAEKKLKFYLP